MDERQPRVAPHRVLPESGEMYAAMAPASTVTAAVAKDSVKQPKITRRQIIKPVPGEDHRPIHDERFAWLVQPRAVRQAQEAAIAAAAAPRPPSPLAGPTHPIVSQPTPKNVKVWS